MRRGLYQNQSGMAIHGNPMMAEMSNQVTSPSAAQSLPQFGVDHQVSNPQGKTIYAQQQPQARVQRH